MAGTVSAPGAFEESGGVGDPFLDLEYLKRTVEGIEAAGYRFVDPASP